MSRDGADNGSVSFGFGQRWPRDCYSLGLAMVMCWKKLWNRKIRHSAFISHLFWTFFVILPNSFAREVPDFNAKIISFDLKTALTAISFLRSQKEVPDLGLPFVQWLELASPLPKEFTSTFDDIQTTIFASPVFKLANAHPAVCISCVSYNPKVMKVYIGSAFIDKIRGAFREDAFQVVANFIMAHEISHYAYDLLVHLSSSRQTPFGQVASGIFDLPQNLKDLTGPEDKDKTIAWSIWKARQHSEVDTYAVAILYSRGLRDFSALESFMDLMSSNSYRSLQAKGLSDDEFSTLLDGYIDWKLRQLSLKQLSQRFLP